MLPRAEAGGTGGPLQPTAEAGGQHAESPPAEPASIPELLAPAGGPRALRAALSAGADAVYFGLERWSARAFADNFAGDEAVAAVEAAHLYGARAYLALNTLLKDDEIEPALAALEAPYRAGLDALIVADLGVAGRVRAEYPDLPLHASTQLNTHCSAQLAALRHLGFARAILARELSLEEICDLERHGLELEAFVHGALCYGYSGNCLLSSMVGGRSGNRGRCSQSCRLRYSLRREGGSAREPSRIMSTGDLAAIGMLPDLLRAGVTSFKIEGRMKDAAYVGVTTAVYREALDAALVNPEGYQVRPEWNARLEQAFSRSFTSAHLEGRHDEVRSGGRGGHRGVLVGRVSRIDEATGEIAVRLSTPVAEGDIVYLYTPWGQTEPRRLDSGGERSLTLRVRERVALKDRLFRLAAAEAGRLAHDLSAARIALRPIGLAMRLSGKLGSPPELWVTEVGAEPGMGRGTGPGPEPGMDSDTDPGADPGAEPGAGPGAPRAVRVRGDEPLAAARSAALTRDKAAEALGALGGTPYALAALDYAVDDGLFLAVGQLKGLRRRALAELDARRLAAARRTRGRARPPVHPGRRPKQLADSPARSPEASTERSVAPSRSVDPPARSTEPSPRHAPQATSRATVSASLEPPPLVLRLRPGEPPALPPDGAVICVDALAGDSPADIAAALRDLRGGGLQVRLRLPEILFDGDAAWAAELLGLSWDAVVVRTAGLLGRVTGAYVIEYPLQGLNHLSARVATELAGGAPVAVTASPEASLPEIAALVRSLAADHPTGPPAATGGPPSATGAPPAIEILAFGRQQVLHTRDRLGRAEGLFEAPGPDEHIRLVLEDAKGYAFPADVDADGTRVFNARVTNLAPNLDELREAGVVTFIVDQAEMNAVERAAFAAGGLEALAPLASRERSTTGHLFRGVV